jgi:hypothetical protein
MRCLALPLAASVLITCLTVITFLAVWHRTAGHVWFTLDDPYIHLALAQHIAATAHYGINSGELAAPSSSILYPFVLAALLKLGLGQAAPMLVCFVATIISGLLFCAILRRAGYFSDESVRRTTWPGFLMLCILVFAGNLIGLEFTGMEHAAQVAVSLACVLGVVRFLQNGIATRYWLVCAIAAPLVRYEGASLWLGTVLLLMWHRRWAPAAFVGLVGAAALGAFSLWLHMHGLAWLPSSVLAKLSSAEIFSHSIEPGRLRLAEVEALTLIAGGIALLAAGLRQFALAMILGGAVVSAAVWLEIAAAGAPLAPPWQAVIRSLLTYGIVQFALLGIVIAACLPRSIRSGDSRRAQCALFGLLILAAHAAEGRFGWFSRYEAYAIISGAAIAAVVWAAETKRWASAAGPIRQGLATLGIMLAMLLYGLRIFQTPTAAELIYDRQYQMHRFITEFFPGPAAVNDLGLVSYGNNNYVLDLWGLGSEAARRARIESGDPNWMAGITRGHKIDVAIIFTHWFPHVPAEWRLAGTLTADAPNYVGTENASDFYATSPVALPRLRAALALWSRDLPSGDHLHITSGDEPPVRK